MNRLLEIGFKYAGNWSLTETGISYTLKHHEHEKNVLYAFICNGDINYIGKTTQSLTKRMYGYQNPGISQATNKKNNINIIGLLKNNQPVDIFVFSSSGLLKYGSYQVNLAAGLEDSLIEKIAPEWNGVQKIKHQNGTQHPTIHTDGTTDSKNTFQLQLGTAYYNQGFINVPIKFSEVLGKDGEKIQIYLADSPNPILGYINRTATGNQAPRIMGSMVLKRWIQENRQQGQFITVNLLDKNKLQIELL